MVPIRALMLLANFETLKEFRDHKCNTAEAREFLRRILYLSIIFRQRFNFSAASICVKCQVQVARHLQRGFSHKTAPVLELKAQNLVAKSQHSTVPIQLRARPEYRGSKLALEDEKKGS